MLTPLAIVVEPVLEMEKRVVVALWVEEPTAKSALLVSPLLAWTENLANGEEVPTPVVPLTMMPSVGAATVTP